MTPGAILAKSYQIVRTIGSGGMGDVYQARRIRDNAYVAVKILRMELVKDNEAVTRFRREGRAAAALKSPHAARILDVGETSERQPFIVMEYLEGCDLMSEIDTRGALPVGEAVSYVVEACHAMIEAHELGIVHRDLKPPNLFLAQEGNRRVVKVLDFGISKISTLADGHVTSTQMSFGSPLYMSPEQIRSTKLVDARSDVWSLGVILYEALTGEPPFMGETPGALAVVISVEPHTAASTRVADIPPGLDDVIAGALQKDPKKRYPSVREFLRALEDYLPKEEGNLGDTIRDTFIPSRAGIDHATPPLPTPRRLGDPPARNDPTLAAYARTGAASGGERADPITGEAPPAKTLVIPPRITLGPATTDPPTAPSKGGDRIGLILAAFLIPLGALAFGFAIWLYSQRSNADRGRTTATATASAVEEPTAVGADPDRAPEVTTVPSTGASSSTSASGGALLSASAPSATSATAVVSTAPVKTAKPPRPKRPPPPTGVHLPPEP